MPKPGQEVIEDLIDPEDGGQVVEVEDDEAGTAAADGGRVIDPADEEAADSEFKRLDNKAFAAMRKANTDMKKQLADATALREENERLKSERQTPAQRAPEQHPLARRDRRTYNGVIVPETRKEWDDLAAVDWQTAVDLKAIIKAEEIGERQAQTREGNRVMEESKQAVLAKHTELKDVNSEKSKVFLEILRENPEYLNMPKGPIIAMREMEARLDEQGHGPTSVARAAGASSEAARQNRVALSASGGRIDSSIGAAKTVTLSKDEMEFCNSQGLDPKKFAARKLELSSKKGAL